MSIAQKDESLDIDEIFNRLKQSTKVAENSENKEVTENLDNKNLTYENLKRKVSHLPSIEVHLFAGNKKSNGAELKKKKREIQRINDSVESVLPDPNKKTVKDRRLIKEEKSNAWFAMPKVEMTDEIKRDLLIIKNRKYLDPKRFYRGEKWDIPENFQMGEIVEGVGEYGGRMKRKQRGKTLVDELLKNEQASEWFSKTYKDIQVQKKSGGKKFLQDKINKRRKY